MKLYQSVMNGDRPAFLITIDTEGDDLWSAPREITTRNSAFIPRFQNLSVKYGFKPTYLTDYDMARCPVFREFATGVLTDGQGEIGMHLHGWNTPPLVPITPDDFRYLPYLIEYPEPVMRKKIRFMTDLLQDTFNVPMRSHRSGRYAFNSAYARCLSDYGYKVDCSVTPHCSWKDDPGDPAQSGGTDYLAFPDEAYFIDLNDISSPGGSDLLEVPITIQTEPPLIRRIKGRLRERTLPRRCLNWLFPGQMWLRPRGNNVGQMKRILRNALDEGRYYVEFILHSSELMPGGNPTFTTDRQIEGLYADLEELFELASRFYTGKTLTEFYVDFKESQGSRPAAAGQCPPLRLLAC